MELAIEVAAKCVSEEGKISPKVGAVVARDGVVLAAAHRVNSRRASTPSTPCWSASFPTSTWSEPPFIPHSSPVRTATIRRSPVPKE